MPAPLFLIAAPLVLALLLFPVRRWPQIAGPVAAGACWILAAIFLSYDLAPELERVSWELHGQVFELTEQTQLLFAAVYALLGLIFLLSGLYVQSGIFIALTLGVLSPLSAALMVEEFVFGAVWLLIAAGGLAVLIQGSGAGSTLAALRFLSLTAIALPLLLSVAWMDESDQFRFLDSITLLNAVALLLLTTTFPFQIWVAPVVRESSSLTPSIVYGVGQLLVVVFSLNLLIDQPFVYGSAQFQTILRLSAGATLILGAVLTVTARSFGQQLGYLLLISIGAVMAVIGSGAVSSVEITLSLLFLRVFGLILAGAGLAMIRKRARVVEGEDNQFTANKGLAWTTPFGMGLFVFGCLSLAGMPLTPGFAGVWPAVLAVGKLSSWLAVVLVFSIAGGAFGVLRRLIPLLSRPDESAGERAVSSETRKEQLASGAILVVGAIVAVFPSLVLTFTSELAGLL